MGEAEAYYKIIPNLTLKYSSLDTIFIPTDKKSLRSKFLMKLTDTDENLPKGAKVKGGKDGFFLEKPDLIDKFCRREITNTTKELGELSAIQFGKMYQPYNFNKTTKITHNDDDKNQDEDTSKEGNVVPWKDDEDRVTNFYVTANPKYHHIRLPEIIRLKDPFPGEVPIFKKRSFPKAARIHKKREDNDPHQYFLSELMLYTGYTDEQDLGCDDEDKCRAIYLRRQTDIQLVKKLMMPFTQGVEEARYYVQKAMENNIDDPKVGNELDPELEKGNLECQDEIENIHPDFVQVNPDDLDIEDNVTQVKKTLRSIEIKSADEILEEARKLDKFQKKILHVAIKFAQTLKIARKGKCPYPCAPIMMIHGGAGSGKSTVINVMCQYIQHILRKEGDDPDCPYVLLSAFTGGAASNINGQTLHTLFSFNFGAGYQSLSDKNRDQKRNLYKNLKVLIIDEISLVDADMLYRIDLRLREITQKDMPFGNVAILAFGDLMQIKPVKGRYIMQCPVTKQFWITYEIDSLWHNFECIVLENNHRQGEDKEYANMLNRIREGMETTEDIEKLRERVRNENHHDIIKEKDALYIFGTNSKVNQMNNRRLKTLKKDEKIIRLSVSTKP